MKVMYVLPRYHTNMVATIEGWLENGHEVAILSHCVGKIEDHTALIPTVIGYSKLYKACSKIWFGLFFRKNPWFLTHNMKYGFPPVTKLTRAIKDFDPDVVITRERSIYSIFATAICRLYHYPTILYDQSPVWDTIVKTDLPHRIVYKFTPRFRITPVELRGIDRTGLVKTPNSYFTPFLCKPHLSPDEREYYANGRINLFSVGKYQERKNHYMMVEAVSKLAKEFNIHLTIAGEISDKFHQEYYDKLLHHIKEQQLENIITLKVNLTRAEMANEYRLADLHIQPSSGEPAGFSFTEAFSFSVPAISGTDNGTASYITPGVNGDVFTDRDTIDLTKKIESIIKDPATIPQMGRVAYQTIIENHQFDHYYEVVTRILQTQIVGAR